MKKKPTYFVHSGDEKNGVLTDKMAQAAEDLPLCWQVLQELDEEIRNHVPNVHGECVSELRQDYAHIAQRAEYSLNVLVDGGANQ
jgi:hypothetical protein